MQKQFIHLHNFSQTSSHNSNSVRFNLGLGYERRIPIMKRFYSVLGFEGYVGYDGTFQNEKIYTNGQEVEEYETYNTISTHIMPSTLPPINHLLISVSQKSF